MTINVATNLPGQVNLNTHSVLESNNCFNGPTLPASQPHSVSLNYAIFDLGDAHVLHGTRVDQYTVMSAALSVSKCSTKPVILMSQ